MKPLLHFFENKVTIILQNKQIVKGLLKSIDYQTKTITLIDVEDWGSEEGAYHKTVPVNAKYNQKTFEISDVLSIEYQNSHFRDDNKKYNKEDFFDHLQSGQSQKRYEKPKYKKYVEKRRND